MAVTQQRECRGSLIDSRNPLGHFMVMGIFTMKRLIGFTGYKLFIKQKTYPTGFKLNLSSDKLLPTGVSESDSYDNS